MLRAVILTTSHCALEAACQARRCCTGLGWPTPPARGSQDSLTTSHRRTTLFSKKKNVKISKKRMVKSQSLVASKEVLATIFLCHSTGFSNNGTSVCALSKQTNTHAFDGVLFKRCYGRHPQIICIRGSAACERHGKCERVS